MKTLESNAVHPSYPDDFFILFDHKLDGINFPSYQSHNVYEIYLLESGERNLTLNHTLYPTKALDAAMISPFDFHRSSGDTPYSGICFNFTYTWVKRYYTKPILDKMLSCFQYPVISISKEGQKKIHQLIRLVGANPEWKFLYFGELMQIFLEESEGAAHNPIAPSFPLPVLATSSNSYLSATAEYITDHLTTIRSLDEISSHLGISKAYLCNLFKKNTALTLSGYINTLRIQYACTLLSASRSSNHEIAFYCGFDSDSYFSRTFKKVMHCTPGEFRRLEASH